MTIIKYFLISVLEKLVMNSFGTKASVFFNYKACYQLSFALHSKQIDEFSYIQIWVGWGIYGLILTAGYYE